jgi:hypothetical protein
MDGTNGGTTFTNSASGGPTITTFGNAQTSTGRSVFGGASGLFDGSGDYLQTSSNSSLAIGTGPLQLEMRLWIPSSRSGAQDIIYDANPDGASGTRNNGFLIYKTTGNKIGVFDTNTVRTATTSSVTYDAWMALAVTRDASGVWNYFIDGVKDSSSFTSTVNCTQTVHLIGKACDNTGFFTGSIDELRLTKAVRNSSNYTLASSAFPDR